MINIKNRKVFIETYGCQMNEYDTELVKAILSKEGYSFVQDELAADIVMLNTCAIREHAHRKVYGRIHEIKHNRNGAPVKFGLLGCMATNLRSELLETQNLKIDFIAGPDSYKRLPDLIAQCYETEAKHYDLTLSEYETYSDIYPQHKKGVNAWLAVSRGCNNFCTFCVVPYTRGRERSRSPENVVEEVQRLAAEGFKQVTLLGQNVNSYRHEEADFAHLLEKVSEVKGIERIRFTSPHPKDFPRHLLKVIATNPKVCKQVHLPLQAGNNRILELMNRSYTKEEFLDLVAETRSTIPGVALSTDIIVGFCSETNAEFEDTIDVLQRVEFDWAFTFKYSERKQTMASRKFPDDVSDETKKERIMRLTEIQKEITLKKNQAHIGETYEVLMEEGAPTNPPDISVGRADNNKLIIIPKNGHVPGDFVDIRITGATPHALKGTPARS